ncbi:class I SAM-dependent methyltransferase [Gammaproteobacteria bacterium]|nr:class I SAM-dependent methyltransferase [Gammaproteobacteria bacterium]
MNDRFKEKERYDARASLELAAKDNTKLPLINSYLIEPYEFYNKSLKEIPSNSKVLEIGAGMGENTEYLLKLGHSVCATDISSKSVEVMKKKYSNYDLFSAQVADMESLPFESNSFDCVCSAGSLSYGDNKIVMDEIHRVLNKKGFFITVDSLNHNIIFRLNRYIHYLNGSRSKSTLKRMPNIKLIKNYEKKFGYIHVKYFGSLTWFFPALKLFMNDSQIKSFSQMIDKKFKIKKSAFKFVMKAIKN